MSEAGRKLTIRMPDNPRLRSVVVGQMHVDPGGRVMEGTPVMSLEKKRRDHIVRAPRPGRIVPLVAVGDKVEPGDPLYILHIDEAALAEAKKSKNALVPTEQAKWSSGVTPDLIRPIARGRKRPPKPKPQAGTLGGFAARWGKPVLAIALYVLACFALLPILHAFAGEASTPILAAMCAGVLAFGALIYFLYRPDQGAAPRWTVRMVAASWVGLAGAAIFYQPDVTEDITLAEATERVGDFFTIKDEALAVAEPQDVVEPPAVLASGVQYGRTLVASAPQQTAPSSILSDQPESLDDPHHVEVRAWARVNPTNDAGTPLEAAPAVPPATAGTVDRPVQAVALAAAEPRKDGDAVVLAATLADPPLAPVSDARQRMAVVPIVEGDAPVAPVAVAPTQVAQRTELRPATEALSVAELAEFSAGSLPGETRAEQDRWLAIDGVPVLAENGAPTTPPPEPSWTSDVEPSTAPVPGLPSDPVLAAVTSARPAPVSEARVKALASRTAVPARAGWLSDHGLPVLLSPGTSASVPRDAPFRGQIASLRPDRAGEPLRPRFGSNPDLLLVGTLRAGDGDWMSNQAALLGTGQTASSAVGKQPGTADAPKVALVGPDLAPGPEFAAPLVGPASLRSSRLQPAQAIPETAPLQSAAAPAEAALALGAQAGQPDAGAAPAGLELAAIPAAVPTAPIPDPGTEERLLLFVYFDDPRLESHPGVGDPWAAPVSAPVAEAVQASEVVAVKQIVQVESWCPAANDPEGALAPNPPAGFQTALLSDRIRLLEVRVEVDAARVAAYEAEIGLFGGQPAGFFHNRAPLMGALPGAPLLDDGMAYLRSLAAGIIDPNRPAIIEGGQYFDSPIALAAVLRGAGCVQAEWNGGDGPENAIGRDLDARLGG